MKKSEHKTERNVKEESVNPFQDRDLNQQLRFPVISWSSINSFTEYNKDEWYESYVLGNPITPNRAMTIGIEVGERITQDPTFLPTIERPDIFEYDFDGLVDFNGIDLRGHVDGYFDKTIIGQDEYKTSANENRWTQKKVDTWGQITMYCLLRWLKFKIHPDKLRLRLYAIPITEHPDFSYTAGEPQCFYTTRTMLDLVRFGKFIKDTHKEMTLFVKSKQT